MAIPDPEVEEILSALAESDLSVLAVVGREAIADLPRLGESDASARKAEAIEQLEALSHAILAPLKQEAEALDRLPQLAGDLGLEPSVQVIDEDGSGTQTIELTDPVRKYLLDRFMDALGQSIGAARERILARPEREQ